MRACRDARTVVASMEVQLHTFLFADISSYSVLTEREGDEAAAELAISFSEEVERLAAACGASVVRRIGDGVMVHCLNAADAIALGLQLVRADHGRPAVHAGVHSGPALSRADDWWGATVNVTSRVAAVARAGELLVTEHARRAAGAAPHGELSALGAIRLRNVSEPVSVYSSRPPRRGLLTSLADLRLRAGRLLDDVADRGLGRQGLRADVS